MRNMGGPAADATSECTPGPPYATRTRNSNSQLELATRTRNSNSNSQLELELELDNYSIPDTPPIDDMILFNPRGRQRRIFCGPWTDIYGFTTLVQMPQSNQSRPWDRHLLLYYPGTDGSVQKEDPGTDIYCFTTLGQMAQSNQSRLWDGRYFSGVGTVAAIAASNWPIHWRCCSSLTYLLLGMPGAGLDFIPGSVQQSSFTAFGQLGPLCRTSEINYQKCAGVCVHMCMLCVYCACVHLYVCVWCQCKCYLQS